jgi:hypothetical protein
MSSGMLATVGLLELLKADSRPSCVVDLDDFSESQGLPRICFRNARFSGTYDFEAAGRDLDSPDNDRLYFRSWALSRPTQDSGSTLNCYGMSWAATTIRKR